jgi:hypothetical protein
MNEALRMYEPPTFEVLPNAISLPASESGVTPCGLPDGLMRDLFGREVAPVRVSVPQDKAKGLMTLATSGHIGHPSSGSAALQRSLESRLHQQLDTAGSTLFTLTWKRRRTPLGRPYLERQAVVRRTSGSGCTSVPTPQAHDKQGPKTEEQQALMRAKGHGVANLNETAMLSSVPTPDSPNSRGGGQNPEKRRAAGHAVNLQDTVTLASVPTPMAGSPTTETYNAAGNNDYSRKIVELASVITPTREDHKSDGPKAMMEWEEAIREGRAVRESAQRLRNQAQLATVATPRSEDSQCAGAHRGLPDTLHSQANLASVTTPSARDWKDTSGMSETGVDPDGSIRSRLDQLPRQAQLAASGPTATGGTGKTGNIGQLNPSYSRWLMGLPPVWDTCVQMVNLKHKRKSAKRRKRSCELCGGVCGLCVHHRDENPLNNSQSNLQTLCASCHRRSHSPNFMGTAAQPRLCAHCSNPAKRHGLCWTHRTRLKRHGNPLAKKVKQGSVWVLPKAAG